MTQPSQQPWDDAQPDQPPDAGQVLPLAEAAGIEEARRGSAAELFHALVDQLTPDEQHWLDSVLARHQAAQRAADAAGQRRPEALW